MLSECQITKVILEFACAVRRQMVEGMLKFAVENLLYRIVKANLL